MPNRFCSISGTLVGHRVSKANTATILGSTNTIHIQSSPAVRPRPESEARVFVVGLPKAGTSTLQRIFLDLARQAKMAGTSCHWLFKSDKNGKNMALGMSIHNAHKHGFPLLKDAQHCRFLSQMDYLSDPKKQLNCTYSFWPQMTLLKELDHQYPGSKFILNTRPTIDHIKSIDHWGTLRQRLIHSDIPRLPPGKGATDVELGDWIEGHNQRVRNYFHGRSNDYMEVKLGETSTKDICNFLRSITSLNTCRDGDAELPHANMGHYNHSSMQPGN